MAKTEPSGQAQVSFASSLIKIAIQPWLNTKVIKDGYY